MSNYPVDPQVLADGNPDERVTTFTARDVQLPGGVGTMALITMDNGFDHTKPTTFGPGGILNALATFTEVKKRADAKEIVAVGLTGKPHVFAVGADLSDIDQIDNRDQALTIAKVGHDAFRMLGEMGVPSFAFINGAAMGGGVEAALHCDYRTVSPTIMGMALPECLLGLVPGWGGTYLLPRLIGPQAALKVIVENALANNKMLKGPQVADMGIADALIQPRNFLEDSLEWAAKVVAGDITVDRTDHTADAGTWDAVCDGATDILNGRVNKQAPAPYRAVDLVRAARTNDRDAGFAAEDEALADLIMSDEFRAGVYAFNLTQHRARKPAGAPDKSLARNVTKVGIVGAGLMASQLAMLFIQRMQVPVVMTDLDQERVDKGVAYVHGEIDKLAAKGRLSGDSVNRYKALITGSTSKDGFADADFVIEAVFEEMSIKQQVFAQCEDVVSPECVLATNTSSLSVSEMAKDLKHPERVVGFHFFNPVAIMPLLEIIRAEKTDDAALATAFAVGKKLKKTTVGAKDSASFIVNRLLGRFMGEVGKIVEEGTPIPAADAGVGGLAPMPPFDLIALVGPAIALHNSESLHAAFGDRFHVSEDLKKIVDAKLGAYYLPGTRDIDPKVAELMSTPDNPVELSADQVRQRVLEALADEIGRMLDEEVVIEPQDIDLAMITGAGFSFWNGGITPLLDRTGVAESVNSKRFLDPGVASVS